MANARDGREWQPEYLLTIDAEKCIGCGRCYKVCGREVMTLKGLNEDGDVVDLDDEDDDEITKKVMVMPASAAAHAPVSARPIVRSMAPKP
jgi:Nif-specific ferredoxin III